MNRLIEQMQIQVNEKTYLKDPNSSDLGKNIISIGIELIDEMGLERFTFRKLAERLNTAESSVYRYFESKNKLLFYLTSWYWGWLEYRLVFSMMNIKDPQKRLEVAIGVISEDIEENERFSHIDLCRLSRIVISESPKAYLTKEVDYADKEGFFSGYKRLVERLSDVVLEIKPDYEHPHTLISSIIEGIFHQKYFAGHIPSLTDLKGDSESVSRFFNNLAVSTLKGN